MGKNGEKMGEIRPKRCEGRELTTDQLAGGAGACDGQRSVRARANGLARDLRGAAAGAARDGIPTPPSPLFLGRFAPVLRRFSAVLLCCLASWRQDGENGRKMAENGRNLGAETGEKQRWLSGVGHRSRRC